MSIKKHFPIWFKYPFWWLIKAPQRKLGPYTLIADIRAITGYLLSKKEKNKPALLPVTICTGLSKRSENYINFLLHSVLQMEHQDLIILSVFDCSSTDIPELKSIIQKSFKGKLIFSSQSCSFSRSFTFNKAIQQAPDGLIFACDADVSLPYDFVQRCNRVIVGKRVWFPILKAEKEKEGYFWFTESTGMFGCMKKNFEEIGGYDENFKVWGLEDTDLWLRFYKKGFWPLRLREQSMLHHWHVPADKKYN